MAFQLNLVKTSERLEDIGLLFRGQTGAVMRDQNPDLFD
jgi:hypothetical protein